MSNARIKHSPITLGSILVFLILMVATGCATGANGIVREKSSTESRAPAAIRNTNAVFFDCTSQKIMGTQEIYNQFTLEVSPDGARVNFGPGKGHYPPRTLYGTAEVYIEGPVANAFFTEKEGDRLLLVTTWEDHQGIGKFSVKRDGSSSAWDCTLRK